MTTKNNHHIMVLNPFDKRWIAFAELFPQASIFHHPAWIGLLAACYHYRPFVLALLDKEGRLHAGIPMMEVSSYLTGRRWVALPFTDYCPPLYDCDSALEDLTQSLEGLYQDHCCPRIEIRWELPARSTIKSVSSHVMHTLDLHRDIELILKSIHRTQRQNIKTAEKNGIQISKAADLDHLRKFYQLHCLTRKRQGVPVQPWRFFELLLKNVIEDGLGFILLACRDDQCLAAGLFLHWRETLTYKYAASSNDGQDMRPNHLLTWTAIQWGCENGFKVFDFGRTDKTNDGLRTFKNRWGANEEPLKYSLLTDTLPRTGTGKFGMLMHTVILNAPLWFCRLSGELLYKHFG